MKRFTYLSLFVVLLSVGRAYAQTDAVLSLPTEVNVSPNDSLEISLKLTTDSLITSAQITIEFDSTKLKFVDIAPGNGINGFSISAEPDPFPPTYLVKFINEIRKYKSSYSIHMEKYITIVKKYLLNRQSDWNNYLHKIKKLEDKLLNNSQ